MTTGVWLALSDTLSPSLGPEWDPFGEWDQNWGTVQWYPKAQNLLLTWYFSLLSVKCGEYLWPMFLKYGIPYSGQCFNGMGCTYRGDAINFFMLPLGCSVQSCCGQDQRWVTGAKCIISHDNFVLFSLFCFYKRMARVIVWIPQLSNQIVPTCLL